MKKIALIISFTSFIFILIPQSSKGQGLHIGANTAVNTTFVLDKGLSEDPRFDAIPTYNFAPIGFSFGYDLSPGFGLQLEALWAKYGQIYEVIDAARGAAVGEREIDLNYFQIPLFLKFMSAKDTQLRTNFSLGPQLAILTSGLETLQYAGSTQNFPEGTLIEPNMDGTFTITDPHSNVVLTDQAERNADGSYTMPELPLTELLSTSFDNEVQKFKNAELQIAASLGLDIDLSKHLYLSTLVRVNYSFTDMRNDELIDFIQQSTASDLFNKRANVSLGIQLGLNYMFGGTRFFGGN